VSHINVPPPNSTSPYRTDIAAYEGGLLKASSTASSGAGRWLACPDANKEYQVFAQLDGVVAAANLYGCGVEGCG